MPCHLPSPAAVRKDGHDRDRDCDGRVVIGTELLNLVELGVWFRDRQDTLLAENARSERAMIVTPALQRRIVVLVRGPWPFQESLPDALRIVQRVIELVHLGGESIEALDAHLGTAARAAHVHVVVPLLEA